MFLFILFYFYFIYFKFKWILWDFDFHMFARKINIKAEGFLVCVYTSDVALGFFEAFHTVLVFLFLVLGGLITLRFQPFHISPLETHFATFLVFIVATIVYGIAYVLITLQPPNSQCRAIFSFICLVFGIIAIELLVSTIIPPRWLFIVNLWLILIVGVLCLCKQIYRLLCYTAILVFNAVPSLFEKIYQLVHQIYDRLLQIFQSAICQAFSSREREDNDNQGLLMV